MALYNRCLSTFGREELQGAIRAAIEQMGVVRDLAWAVRSHEEYRAPQLGEVERVAVEILMGVAPAHRLIEWRHDPMTGGMDVEWWREDQGGPGPAGAACEREGLR